MVNFLRPHVGNFTATRGSHILTMQRYYILIAVYECFSIFFLRKLTLGGHDGQGHDGQNGFLIPGICPKYIIKYILLYI